MSLGFSLCMYTEYRRMNRALQRFDAVFIIPVLQVIWILFSIISGGLYFKEFESLDVFDGIMFIAGVLLILIGVFLLSPKDSDVRIDGSGEATLDVVPSHTDMAKLNSWMDTNVSIAVIPQLSERGFLRAPASTSVHISLSNIDNQPSVRRGAAVVATETSPASAVRKQQAAPP